jgi:hypothetical protein
MNGGKPVVALDVDGTLGDYHGHFTRFARDWTGRPLPLPADVNPGLPLHKHLGMSKRLYRECKLAYRRGGLKRSMPCYEGASELTRHMRRSGAQVWICTTRPYLRFDGIDPDTRHWLRRNGIQWDGVLFGERKLRDLVTSVGRESVMLVADDLPEVIAEATRILPFAARVLRDQPYNRHYMDPAYLRVHDMQDIQVVFDKALGLWKRTK